MISRNSIQLQMWTGIYNYFRRSWNGAEFRVLKPNGEKNSAWKLELTIAGFLSLDLLFLVGKNYLVSVCWRAKVTSNWDMASFGGEKWEKREGKGLGDTMITVVNIILSCNILFDNLVYLLLSLLGSMDMMGHGTRTGHDTDMVTWQILKI